MQCEDCQIRSTIKKMGTVLHVLFNFFKLRKIILQSKDHFLFYIIYQLITLVSIL